MIFGKSGYEILDTEEDFARPGGLGGYDSSFVSGI